MRSRLQAASAKESRKVCPLAYMDSAPASMDGAPASFEARCGGGSCYDLDFPDTREDPASSLSLDERIDRSNERTDRPDERIDRSNELESPSSATLEAMQEQVAEWRTTYNKDDARDKAYASHETMGLVSALMAGFELQSLTEVDICSDSSECTSVESCFIVAASFCVGLSTVVVLETSFEYMLVLRELHHGAPSAWNLIQQFRYARRVAELAFSLDIIMFLVSTGLMVYVRFSKTLPVGTAVSIILLSLMAFTIFVIVALMQYAKVVHGQGSRRKREELKAEIQRLSPLTLHPSPFTLTPHPSPSPFTLTLHPHPPLSTLTLGTSLPWDRTEPSPSLLTTHYSPLIFHPPTPSPFTPGVLPQWGER